MSDTAGLQGHIYTETSTVRTVKQQTKGTGILKIFIILLFIVLTAETVFYLLILPFSSAAKVQFSGSEFITDSDFKKLGGLTGTEKWGSFDTHTLSRKLAAYPLIQTVEITKKYPDKVFVKVTERKAVAVLLAVVAGRTVPMEIDKTGTVFRIRPKVINRTLPVISGLEFQHARAGMKVHKQLLPLFSQLDILQKKNPVLLSEISEMKIEQKKYGGFDLIIYPVRTRIKVRTTGTLSEDRLRYMMLALDVMRDFGHDSQIEELDVRAGTAAYRLREVTNE
ncbi:MAG: FtsQ-type POTRA domain-containing protein [Treponema sp.]